MSNTKVQLRLNGYSANGAGIICDTGIERFKHERTGVLRIVASRDTKAARALMDAVVAAIDEPRALCGRDRHGVVMLFRAEEMFNGTTEIIALRDGEEIVISLALVGTVEPSAYTWAKGRSPFEISRDALPQLRYEFAKIASEAAWAAGARSSDDFARERESDRYRADLASGKIKVRTQAQADEDQQARDDAETVAASEGLEIRSHAPDNTERLILDARRRHAERQRKQTAAA